MARLKQIEIGSRLRAVRLASGYETAREFAAIIGVREGTYWTYERGLRGIPLDHLSAIIQRLGVTSDYLLFGDVSGLPVEVHRKLRKRAGAKYQYKPRNPEAA